MRLGAAADAGKDGKGGKGMTLEVIGGMTALAAPLILCALGGLICGKGGVRNLALEGIMIVGGVAGCLALSFMEKDGAPILPAQAAMLLALLTAGIAGMIFSLPLALTAKKADAQLTGVGLNLLSPALCVAVLLALGGRIGGLTVPNWAMIDGWRALPVPPYLTTPAALLLTALTGWFLYHTRWGQRIRLCGENAEAVRAGGYRPGRVRGLAAVLSGFLCGVSGLCFIASVGPQGGNAVAGWGFVALAAVIAGRWRMSGTVAVCLFISLVGSLAAQGQTDVIGGEYLALAAPYVLALVLMCLGGRAPKEEAIQLDADER